MDRIKKTVFLVLAAIILISWEVHSQELKPYTANPFYWQYKGQPVLLLGAFNGAHGVFFKPDVTDPSGNLIDLMEEMVSAGGNVMRCVFDPGSAVTSGYPAWYQNSSDIFDLNIFTSGSSSFWGKFDEFLLEADKRDIIVQIEVWDRFDWQKTAWESSAFSPVNNVNYTTSESGLANSYSSYVSNPFSNSVPGHPIYDSSSSSQKTQYDLVRSFQTKYIDHLLSISLKYNNILYTMNNETHVDPAWGQYWIAHIKDAAAAKGKTVYVTDMFDNGWELQESDEYKQAFSKPDIYTFVDISQNNSMKITGGPETHWANILYTRNQISAGIRPINNTKIYGSDDHSYSSYHLRVYERAGDLAGQNNFWMNLIGGCASARFHRPTWGMGLSTVTKSSIRAARKLETIIKMWEVEPRNDLLTERGTHTVFVSGFVFNHEPFIYGEAYLAAKPGVKYALYFTMGGSVDLDLNAYAGVNFDLYWINIDTGNWGSSTTISGGKSVRVDAPGSGAWVAAIVSKGLVLLAPTGLRIN